MSATMGVEGIAVGTWSMPVATDEADDDESQAEDDTEE